MLLDTNEPESDPAGHFKIGSQYRLIGRSLVLFALQAESTGRASHNESQ